MASIATAAIHFFLKLKNLSQLEQHQKYQAEMNEQTRVREEAANVTSELRKVYKSSIKCGDECCEHLVQALSWLEQAEGEYEENAPFPYWDAIEYSMQHLNSYEEKILKLSDYAESYYQKLRNRKHTFPLFPVTINRIPDASPVITELRRVVRLGHKNEHFTNILGHRRTQQTLITGFRETVNNLSEAIRESMSQLSASVSSNISMLAAGELKSREVLAHTLEQQDKRLLELNRMVDNIQHNRKPSFRDRPSKN